MGVEVDNTFGDKYISKSEHCCAVCLFYVHTLLKASFRWTFPFFWGLDCFHSVAIQWGALLKSDRQPAEAGLFFYP